MLPSRSPVCDVTAQQDRARLGSGRASPVKFQKQLMGRLLLATDGLRESRTARRSAEE